jgi:hypothetical protein
MRKGGITSAASAWSRVPEASLEPKDGTLFTLRGGFASKDTHEIVSLADRLI